MPNAATRITATQETERLTILYVDDNEARALACNSWFQQAGYRVLYATTGRDAIALLDDERPAACLIDVHLPDIGGVEICRRVKARRHDTPVILVSALFRSPHDQLEGLNDGADMYIAEHLEKAAVLSAIERVMRHATENRRTPASRACT